MDCLEVWVGNKNELSDLNYLMDISGVMVGDIIAHHRS